MQTAVKRSDTDGLSACLRQGVPGPEGPRQPVAGDRGNTSGAVTGKIYRRHRDSPATG